MEIIQATQISVMPQESPTATWNNNSFSPRSHFLTLSTPPEQLFGFTPTNGSFLNNTCQNCTKPEPLLQPGLAGIFIALIYGIVFIVGLVGNTLVIHVIVNYTKNESVTNIYILNLAIADELFMLGLPFLAVQNALLSWPFGSLMCRVVMTVDAINQFTSIFCLTVMSVDRYLAVVHPIRSCLWRRPHVAKAISATVWAGSFVVVLPVVVFANVLKDDGNCSIVWPEPAEVWKTTFIVYTCTVGFFCPLLVICLCYLLIVIKVRNVGKRAQATSSRRRKSERKITRMVVVVVAVFVFCWLPFYVLNIVNLLVLLPGDFRGLYVSVVLLSYANSCANPILYGFLSDNFKRGFRKALCRTSRRVKNNDRVGTEAQRPTDEWGAFVYQMHKSDRVTSAHRENCGEKDVEEEEISGEEGSIQMNEMCKMSQNGNRSGVTEGSRTQVRQRSKPELQHSGHSAKHGELTGKGPGFDSAEAGCSMTSKITNSRSQPEEFLDKNSVLEISYL